jgi:hypothetical protein
MSSSRMLGWALRAARRGASSVIRRSHLWSVMMAATTSKLAPPTGSGKHQAWLPTDHFEKPLEETCPNHLYPVKHKLKNCNMMKNIMAPGSLAQGMEVNEVPDEGNTTPFLGEDVVMTIYDGRPSPRMHHVCNPSIGTLGHYSWGCMNAEM